MIAMHEPGACMVCGDPTSGPSGITCGLDCSHTWNGWRSRRDSMPRKYRVCQGCGEPYIKNRAPSSKDGEKYCSRECAYEDRDTWAVTGVPAKESECAECGCTYLVAASEALRFPHQHCSNECEAQGVVRECQQCGERFKVKRALSERYCGNRCRAARERDRARDQYEPQAQGQAYTRRRLSKKCCETCGAEFLGDSAHKYCDISCRPSRPSGVSRHVPYLLIRDRRRCQICRGLVAWTREWPHPKAPTADHIVPRSRGGSDDLSNLQLAHWRCNAGKGNGSVGSQLRCLG